MSYWRSDSLLFHLPWTIYLFSLSIFDEWFCFFLFCDREQTKHSCSRPYMVNQDYLDQQVRTDLITCNACSLWEGIIAIRFKRYFLGPRCNQSHFSMLYSELLGVLFGYSILDNGYTKYPITNMSIETSIWLAVFNCYIERSVHLTCVHIKVLCYLDCMRNSSALVGKTLGVLD